MADEAIKGIIEAILLSSDKPVLIEQIKNIFDNLDPTEIRKILEGLRLEYETNKRGIRVEEVAGGFQLVTAAEFAPFLKKFYKQRHVKRLSTPTLETLAIIAYKQPVTRLDIESLRSVDASSIVDSLVEKGLVRITGRRQAPGRPFLYGTTKQFLEYFGLKSLEELPKMEDFSKMEGINEPKESAPAN